MEAIWEKPVDCSICMADTVEDCQSCKKDNCKEVEVIQMGCGSSGNRVIIQVGEEFRNVHLSELKPLLEKRYFV